MVGRNFVTPQERHFLSLVKEFYANMKGMIQRKVFIRRDRIKFDEVVNDAIGYPSHVEDDYMKLIKEEVNIAALEAVLYKSKHEIQCNLEKHDMLLNFHVNALLPRYIPLFKLICC